MPRRNAVVPAAQPPSASGKPAYPAKRPVLEFPIWHLFENEPPDSHGENVPECQHFMAAYFDAPKKSDFLAQMQTPEGVYQAMGGRVAALNARFDQIINGLNDHTARVVDEDRFGRLLEHVSREMFNGNAAAELNGALLGEIHSIAVHLKLKADDKGPYLDISVYDYLKKTNHVRQKKVRNPAELRGLGMADFVPEWAYGFNADSRKNVSCVMGFPGQNVSLPPAADLLCPDLNKEQLRFGIEHALEFNLTLAMDCLGRRMHATVLRGEKALALVQPVLDGEVILHAMRRGSSQALMEFGQLLAYCRIPGIHLVQAMAKKSADGQPWLHAAARYAFGRPTPNVIDVVGQLCEQLNVQEGPVLQLFEALDSQGNSAITHPMAQGDAATVQSFADACLRQSFSGPVMIRLLVSLFSPGLAAARQNGHGAVLDVVRQTLAAAGAHPNDIQAFLANP